MTSARFALSTFMLALLASPVFAVDAGSGKILFDARWRLESVDDDMFAYSASANTLRARMGYQTALHAGWSGVIELKPPSICSAKISTAPPMAKPLTRSFWIRTTAS